MLKYYMAVVADTLNHRHQEAEARGSPTSWSKFQGYIEKILYLMSDPCDI